MGIAVQIQTLFLPPNSAANLPRRSISAPSLRGTEQLKRRRRRRCLNNGGGKDVALLLGAPLGWPDLRRPSRACARASLPTACGRCALPPHSKCVNSDQPRDFAIAKRPYHNHHHNHNHHLLPSMSNIPIPPPILVMELSYILFLKSW